LSKGNSSRVTTSSTTPPKLIFAILFCFYLMLFIYCLFIDLHGENLLPIIKELIFRCFFARFSLFKFT
jgi:hypothetical protein